MHNKASLIALVAVVVITTSGAAIQGTLTNRWGESQDMLEAGSRLQAIPQEVPEWKFNSSQQLSDSSRSMLESTGDITRTYVDPITGAAVNLSVIVGPAGTISVHSPEICLPSRSFDLLGERERVTVRDAAGGEHQFWKVTFRSQDINARLLHVYYAWTTGDGWTAPENPRFTYVGAPYLYKIQLSGYGTPSMASPDGDFVPLFLQSFLPLAGESLQRAPTND